MDSLLHKKWLIIKYALLGFFIPVVVFGSFKGQTIVYNAPPTSYQDELATKLTKEQILKIVLLKSQEYGVSFHEMSETIRCESSYISGAVGDSGLSRGLAQIHKPSHPDITDEQAFDPEFAIDFMAREFKKNNQWKWTCWRNLFGS